MHIRVMFACASMCTFISVLIEVFCFNVTACIYVYVRVR